MDHLDEYYLNFMGLLVGNPIAFYFVPSSRGTALNNRVFCQRHSPTPREQEEQPPSIMEE